MRRLNNPAIVQSDVYDTCVSSVGNGVVASKFVAARADVLAAGVNYDTLANLHQLFSLPAAAWGNGDQIVILDLTKNMLVGLYDHEMVEDKKPARKYYAQLMAGAPLGKCPYCWFGHVSTLDHFLSKARYPLFSVLAHNLIPSCRDCNSGKGSAVVTGDSQILHPYYEDLAIESDPWLFAEIVTSSPPTARYFLAPPAGWPIDRTRRLSNYFKDLDLAGRFAVEAATELSELTDHLGQLQTSVSIVAHLSAIAGVERAKRTNSWKAALYEALAASQWYCNGGYALHA